MLTNERLIADQDLVIVRLLQTIASLQRRPRTSHIEKTISDCRRTIAEYENKSKVMMLASRKPPAETLLNSAAQI